MNDPIIESLREKLLKRSEIGMDKYGVGLDRRDLTRLQWLIHHQEELLDAAGYVERQIQDELKDIELRKLSQLEPIPAWLKEFDFAATLKQIESSKTIPQK